MDEKLWSEWFEKEQRKLTGSASKAGKRKYLHFDNRIVSLDDKKTHEMLGAEAIERHSFYPFIRVDTREKRYRRVKNHAPGLRRREETVKNRPIDYASHKDALVYSWYAAQLSAAYEHEILRRNIGDNVIAYRSIKDPVTGRGKGNADFAKEALDFLSPHSKAYVLAIDVSRFYEEIDHRLLKQAWQQVLGVDRLPKDHFNVFNAITSFKFVRKGRIRNLILDAIRKRRSRICTPEQFKLNVIARRLQEKGSSDKGIPQGSPISCVLANIYMSDFDTALKEAVDQIGGFFRRYSDDILIIIPIEYGERIEELVMSEIKKLSLRVQEKKTERLLYDKTTTQSLILDLKTKKSSRFRYLGIESDGKSAELRHGSLARFQRRSNRQARKAVLNAKLKNRSGAPKRYLYEKFGRAKGNFLSYSEKAAQILDAPNILKQASKKRESCRLKLKIKKATKAVGGFKNE